MSIILNTARHIFGKEREFYHDSEIVDNYKKIGDVVKEIDKKTRSLLQFYNEKLEQNKNTTTKDHKMVEMIQWLVQFHKEFENIYEQKKKLLNDPRIKHLLPELSPDEEAAEIIRTQQERILSLLEDVDDRLPQKIEDMNEYELEEAQEMIQQSAQTWRNFIKEMVEIGHIEKKLLELIRKIEEHAKTIKIYPQSGPEQLTCYMSDEEDHIHEQMRNLPLLSLKNVTHKDEFFYHLHKDEVLIDIEHYTINLKGKEIYIIPHEFVRKFNELKKKSN